jgi:hypothetical protein
MVSRPERVTLAVLAALTAIGMVLALYDARLFRVYTSETGPIENLTVAALLGGAVVCFRRLWRLRRRRSALFLLATALLGTLFVVAAGEELSWGQRFLGFTSPEFFAQHNAQRETNLHNLVAGGVKINRLVFGTGLFVAVLAYCSLLPLGYRRWPSVRRLADALAVPVPRLRHVAWYAALALVATLIPSRFKWEVLELVSATVFLLITTLPLNAAAFGEEPARR